MTARRKQLTFRLGMSALTAVGYGILLKSPLIFIIWIVVYSSLQGVELYIFSSQRVWPVRLRRLDTVSALGLLFLNSTVFGSLTAIGIYRLGVWGQTLAAYTLAGAIINTVLTTILCRIAFTASLLPFGILLVLMPVAALYLPPIPTLIVVLGTEFGGLLLLLASVRLWRAYSNARGAEAAAVARDISERTLNEARLFRLAHHDTLTGLPNRNGVRDGLSAFTLTSTSSALLVVDLDSFKYVNDTLGHSAGDKVLCEVAQRLTASVGTSGTIARLGGDEFAILMPNVADTSDASELATRVIAALSQPVQVNNELINIGASVGIAMYPSHGSNPEQLLSNADLALYQAKADGRHCLRFYDPTLRAAAFARISQDNAIRAAIANDEFELFYQPQIRLSDGSLAGAEALLRWRHPERGLLTPAAFLAALQGGALAARVGVWVIETACQQAAIWREAGLHEFRIGINLFSAQFRSGDLVETIISACNQANLPPSALEIEITETTILRQEDNIVGPLRELRKRGVGVAFDDYGTGYASLSLLKRYPLTRLKIDQSFTRSICRSPSDSTIIQAVISMARAFDLEVIAEGVEQQAQADLLADYGCHEAQGYLFGRPMSAASLTRRYLTAAAPPYRHLIKTS